MALFECVVHALLNSKVFFLKIKDFSLSLSLCISENETKSHISFNFI